MASLRVALMCITHTLRALKHARGSLRDTGWCILVCARLLYPSSSPAWPRRGRWNYERAEWKEVKRDGKERPSGELAEGRAARRSKEDVEATNARARTRVAYARPLAQSSVREGDGGVKLRAGERERERGEGSAGLGSHAGGRIAASASQARIISSPGPPVESPPSALPLDPLFPDEYSQTIRSDPCPPFGTLPVDATRREWRDVTFPNLLRVTLVGGIPSTDTAKIPRRSSRLALAWKSVTE